jgi:hypothetical protein
MGTAPYKMLVGADEHNSTSFFSLSIFSAKLFLYSEYFFYCDVSVKIHFNLKAIDLFSSRLGAGA